MRAAILYATDDMRAVEDLHQAGLTDGLPVIVPTPQRVERMVLASGLDAEATLGSVPPAGGDATIEKIAANAVMAGCLPDHFPLVVAAVRAVLVDEFDLNEVQCTTHNVTPMIIVNGPVRHYCEIATGWGALGHGHRANASIGRALRLVLNNLGGGRPGNADMAVLGHGGKFSFCLGEAEEQSPFAPLHVTRGFAREDSTVTVVGCEPPQSVSVVLDGDALGASGPFLDRWLDLIAISLSRPGNNNALLGVGSMTIVVNPLHAEYLAKAGVTREDIQVELFNRARNPGDRLRRLYGQAGRLRDDLDGAGASAADIFCVVERPEDLLVLVAGGIGNFSFVMPSGGVGSHQSRPVTVAVELDQQCSLPRL